MKAKFQLISNELDLTGYLDEIFTVAHNFHTEKQIKKNIKIKNN